MARRRYRDNKSEENLKLMKLTGKEYKTIINKSKAVHRQKGVENLHLVNAEESNEPKAFWNITNRTTKHPNTGTVTIDEWVILYRIRRFAKIYIINGIVHTCKLFLLMYTFIIYQN